MTALGEATRGHWRALMAMGLSERIAPFSRRASGNTRPSYFVFAAGTGCQNSPDSKRDMTPPQGRTNAERNGRCEAAAATFFSPLVPSHSSIRPCTVLLRKDFTHNICRAPHTSPLPASSSSRALTQVNPFKNFALSRSPDVMMDSPSNTSALGLS